MASAATTVCVPMNFGRVHLNTPTHNNLTLNLVEGKKYRANSLILSFNSPVIERLVSTLEITSLDMDDFQETSVRCFVDCCYTGGVELLDRDCFRDVNKMAKVFQVDWLTGKCLEYFDNLVFRVSLRTYYEEKSKFFSYEDMIYFFEEASYAFNTLNQYQLINCFIEKMNPLFRTLEQLEYIKKVKNLFITRYLDDITNLSTDKLDLIVKLAGKDLGIVVQSFATKLRADVSEQGAILPDIFRSFLDVADLRICRAYDKDVFEELFVVLENMTTSYNELKWSLNLFKKACEGIEEIPKLPFQFKAPSQSIIFPENIHKLTEADENFMDFIMGLLVNDEIKYNGPLIFSEAVWRFAFLHGQGHEYYCKEQLDALRKVVKLVKRCREWRSLPPFAVNFYLPDSHTRRRVSGFFKECGMYHEGKPGDYGFVKYTNRTLISCKEKFPETIELTLQQKVTGCKIKGRCGMMFRTKPKNTGENIERTFVDLLYGIHLVTDNSLYPEDLHFHSDVIRADDVHLQVSDKDHIIYPVTPGLCSDPKKLYRDRDEDWEELKFLNDACYLRVIYDTRY